MIAAARNARGRFEGKFLTPRQAEALLEESEFHVYDNPDSFLTCNQNGPGGPIRRCRQLSTAVTRPVPTSPAPTLMSVNFNGDLA